MHPSPAAPLLPAVYFAEQLVDDDDGEEVALPSFSSLSIIQLFCAFDALAPQLRAVAGDMGQLAWMGKIVCEIIEVSSAAQAAPVLYAACTFFRPHIHPARLI
jgi:hypothetical protein